ncbi:20S proteasome maturation protein Ump1, putative [Talaromyces stipitatus ATCC 10500]|uniref:20S proteasome maturation protein Ump1, putative n=1 Tax=Talaromyces stipitatus (strain ATCC 10500 / CBS 375.48 / QM 6759 / NRRL 1006) TaxID=441959 RepID=B8M1N9_TALSN|nr:20S proteasome maturation protein Ump1, putative [Talaromyces stipitatus ATCC 10500]EED22126.1 20S proteasome maturation protein Ump1, putative [Talaromyces stipitatus ATCC 10500]
MSLRFTPSTTHASHTTNTTGRNYASLPHPSKGAPSAPGLPDTLRNNITLQPPRGSPSSISNNQTPTSTHPLEARLLAWRETQDAMKMEGLRRVYGMAEPIRRGMELKIVRDSKFVPMALGGARRMGGDLHEDILVLGGRDTEIGWEDVFHGDEFREPPSIHDEMEKRLKMDW